MPTVSSLLVSKRHPGYSTASNWEKRGALYNHITNAYSR